MTQIKKNILNSISFIITLIVLTIACSREKKPLLPANVIREQKLVSILVDLHQADGYNSLHVDTTKKIDLEVLNNAVLQKHKVSPEQFKETIQYYTTTPQRLDSIYDKVVEKLSEMKTELLPESKEKSQTPNTKSEKKKEKTEKEKKKKRKRYIKDE